MTYPRFALMIAVSTLVMYGLMYLNTYAFEHVFYSETRAWMAGVMGAAMAFVMMGLMFGMYPKRSVNFAIMGGALVVFALCLYFVRSQVTVSGASYMRAMIPHHSIAVMTSGRANIQDARVRKLADEIIGAQQKEIAEMRWLIQEVAAGDTVQSVYEDPQAEVGGLDAVLASVAKAALDPAPVSTDDARLVLGDGSFCTFSRTKEADPILYWTDTGAGVIKLNNVLVPVSGNGQSFDSGDGISMALMDSTGPDWRGETALTFQMQDGPQTGYIGFQACD
ncbi:DUF6692 family protein [Pseudooceanicola sp. MF1-13]|uniref:DUF6692 family protein n=1 Tax=Pseudooceanicola sp. MF1-13 TaxID=3379095 RepID=UPI00389177C4